MEKKIKKIIDVHVHVGNSAALYVSGSVDAVVKRMENHDITHSIISPIPGFEDPEGKETVAMINKQVADIRDQNPGKFPLAFGVAEIRHGSTAVEEAAFALGELRLDGLMFHHDFGGVEMHAPIMHQVIEEAIQQGKPVIQVHTAQHSMLEPPFSLWILAEKYPDVKFLCGHPFMSMIQLDNMAAVAKHCPNVYLDTCCTWTQNNQIETAVEKLGGSEQLLFGTDNPYYDPKICIDKDLVEQADISQADKDNIFYKNFERIFNQVEI